MGAAEAQMGAAEAQMGAAEAQRGAAAAQMWPGPRTRASARNVGQCQERGTVPTMAGARMIGAFRPLQIVSSSSHCHKVQRCLNEIFF